MTDGLRHILLADEMRFVREGTQRVGDRNSLELPGSGAFAPARSGLEDNAQPPHSRKPVDWLFYAIVAAFTLLLVLHAAMLVHWGTALVVPNIPWVIPVTNALVMLVALSVAFLSFGRYAVFRDPVSFWTGMGFAALGTCQVFYVLTWPGLLPDGRSIMGHLPNTAAWIALVTLSLLGVCLLVAVSARWPEGPSLSGQRWLGWVGACLLIIVVMNLSIVVWEDALPTLVEASGKFTPLLRVWQWAVTLLFAIGAVASTRYYLRTGDTLPGYTALALVFLFFFELIIVIGGNRYGLLYFADRFLVIGGFVAMLFGLLSEYVQLYRREQERTRELEQKSAELRCLYDELELRVEHRTAELAAANRELEAFGYTVSHDLRAPLRHILGFIEILNEEAGPSLEEEQRGHLRIVSEAAQRMGKLIDDLLTLSRLGRVAIAKTRVDLGQLVEEVRQELASETIGRTIKWQIGQLPVVRGDPTLLRNAVVNLLSNAIKYTRYRDPARIELECQEKDDEVVCFVRDNGAGFDMRFADNLFGVFQRLHPAGQFEGTGVGLASVRRIIERHGGRVWAEGEVDRGATFYFSLPKKERSS